MDVVLGVRGPDFNVLDGGARERTEGEFEEVGELFEFEDELDGGCGMRGGLPVEDAALDGS